MSRLDSNIHLDPGFSNTNGRLKHWIVLQVRHWQSWITLSKWPCLSGTFGAYNDALHSKHHYRIKPRTGDTVVPGWPHGYIVLHAPHWHDWSIWNIWQSWLDPTGILLGTSCFNIQIVICHPTSCWDCFSSTLQPPALYQDPSQSSQHTIHGGHVFCHGLVSPSEKYLKCNAECQKTHCNQVIAGQFYMISCHGLFVVRCVFSILSQIAAADR